MRKLIYLGMVVLLGGAVSGVSADILWTGYVSPDPSSGSVAGNLNVGFHVSGSMSVDGGSSLAVGDELWIGNFGGTGVIIVDGGILLVSNAASVGYLNPGSLTVLNGGVVNLSSDLRVGGLNASGHVVLDGGSRLHSSGDAYFGSSSLYSGSLEIKGGSTAVLGAVDFFSGSSSAINIVDGTLKVAYKDSMGAGNDMGAADFFGTTLEGWVVSDDPARYSFDGSGAGYYVAQVPEPSIAALFGFGGILLVSLRKHICRNNTEEADREILRMSRRGLSGRVMNKAF